MPTNPLWLEHTERAAWDTVQALRQQIETERGRVEQLLRLQASWPKLQTALRALQAEYSLAGEGPLQIVESLACELARLRAECDMLKKSAEEQARERALQPATKPQRERAYAQLADAAHAGDATGERLAGFLRQLQEHARKGEHKPARSFERLLDALEDALEQLEHAPRAEVKEHALELARLAWQIADHRA